MNRPDVDWERIEAQYRAGTMSLREIAGAHQNAITETAIRKRAKRDKWERDLSAKVRARAEALVRKAEVRSEVRNDSPNEKIVVEVEAQVQARIRLSHRKDIARARDIVMSLLAELEATCGIENAALVQQMGELVAKNNLDNRNDLFKKIVSLPGRAKTMKDLGDSLRTMVGLERQTFGLDDDPSKTIDPNDRYANMSMTERASRIGYILEKARAKAAAEGKTQ